MTSFYPSRWPIQCAAMTGVSDLALALAVHEAGAMPSITLSYWQLGRSERLSGDELHDTLQEFRKCTGCSNLVIGTSEDNLLDPEFLKILQAFAPSHIDFLPSKIADKQQWYNSDFLLALTKLDSTKFMVKIAFEPTNIDRAHGYCVKGQESGGVTGSMPVETLFDLQRQLTPGAAVIPYGGISEPAQVRHYMSKGAAGVAVGTLLAATHESNLSIETKLKMCQAKASDLHRFCNTGQQALVLGNVAAIESDTQFWNRGHSLYQGIHGNGNQGHVYAGKSIDGVKEIRSVKEVIEHLTSELF